ncbi:MBL fold metallo-hydrolase [Alkalibacterium kapii]|uniref:Metallo-beta-lactamase domain-containing protein n=1 Tax=Alkalibacterium kapii TaxID=426704 RepID=A0A511ATB5_9LACT|nr:MBL fold metallo-hydrolase [Alkalibacterium kapii]GEK91430.1 hypothetical protein AKA01nite_10520 [Alkalibacterium kapii]
MKITILGYYGGYPTKGVGTSAYLIEADAFHLLLDAGSSSLLMLEKYIDPMKLDAVLISHYHHDHVADLGVLQFTRLLKKDQQNEEPEILPIYGHSQDKEYFSKLTLENVSQGIDYTDMSELQIGPFEIEKMKTIHPVPCYAFRVTERKTGKNFVFTADTGFKKDLISFSENTDLLLADSNFYAGKENHHVHMTAGECGKIANEANVKHLVLTHLPQYGDTKQLVKDAKEECPSAKVELAQKEMTLTI